ncbi:MAG: Ktr system potassium uptake protein B [Flavobacteriaceae bacterium]|jgi:trk system potassium uptake protein|nr:MAG: Ktr system potassium uptake protein B [Flavobacteriaceae bacterium]
MLFNPKYFYRLSFWTSLFCFLLLIYDFGFHSSITESFDLDLFYYYALLVGLVSSILTYINDRKRIYQRIAILDGLSGLFSGVLLTLHFFTPENYEFRQVSEQFSLEKFAAALLFFKGFLDLRVSYRRTALNPAQLFLISFVVIILGGTLLLSLPGATYEGIGLLDALFTATSAVCVTGLIVVDTATHFTFFGQSILLFLIQIGGLGILTFVSYFSYFFKGEISYEKQIAINQINSSGAIGKELGLLKNILIITLSIEAFSALLIFYNTDPTAFNSLSERVFFSVFHAVSAFCNAGFSTLSESLMQGSFQFNYGLQLAIILTFVIGGLGFPIVSNIVSYLSYKTKGVFSFFDKPNYRPWVLTLNSRIALITTIVLTVGGTFVFFGLEKDGVLSSHSGFGKLVTALFGATTPRTAGFNTVDASHFRFPTLLLTMFLMWVGASPKSTGGGIKTSTLAIAILNILSLARGRERIELYRREIVEVTVKRAFAMISLSIIVIAIGVLGISAFEPDLTMIEIAFESVSAYSTTGLSMGITSSLSPISKFIIIILMFVGRVSALTVLIAIFRNVINQNYRYPKEEITIH